MLEMSYEAEYIPIVKEVLAVKFKRWVCIKLTDYFSFLIVSFAALSWRTKSKVYVKIIYFKTVENWSQS